MKKRHILLTGILVLVAALFLILIITASIFLAVYYHDSKDDDDRDDVTCIIELDMDDMGTDGREYMGKLYAQERFAADAFRDDFDTVEIDFSTRTSGGDYLLAVSGENGNIVVNSDYFSDLVKTDATTVENPTIIGEYKDLAFKDQSPREVVEFLLQSQLITTYWHLNSDVCLVSETDLEESYVANFDASHYYCTNECVTEEYSFSIEIDKESGEIMLLPE